MTQWLQHFTQSHTKPTDWLALCPHNNNVQCGGKRDLFSSHRAWIIDTCQSAATFQLMPFFFSIWWKVDLCLLFIYYSTLSNNVILWLLYLLFWIQRSKCRFLPPTNIRAVMLWGFRARCQTANMPWLDLCFCFSCPCCLHFQFS